MYPGMYCARKCYLHSSHLLVLYAYLDLSIPCMGQASASNMTTDAHNDSRLNYRRCQLTISVTHTCLSDVMITIVISVLLIYSHVGSTYTHGLQNKSSSQSRFTYLTHRSPKRPSIRFILILPEHPASEFLLPHFFLHL